jgi:hypothetical protein
MIDRTHLLTSKQMAKFVADGFLRFDELVPAELNRASLEEFDKRFDKLELGGARYEESGVPFHGLWPESKGVGRVFRLPQVQGIIQSLVGADPLFDHNAIHIVKGGKKEGQVWHADAIIDMRLHFDIQLFYFAQDTPREMGGTMFLPASHFRMISESDIGRYQNFLGQLPVVCKAGTVFVAHHGIWHCAQPNRTDRTRYMFKVRLNPTVRQLRLWNTDDLDDPAIGKILGGTHYPWYGNEARLEVVNRIKLWRFLTGNERFDVDYWLSRLENKPEAVPA